ncbi:SPASM domain-containing protein [Photobacterium sagamiensis]
MKDLNTQCQSCEYKFACFGECPRNRFIATSEGEKGLNFLCNDY